MKIVFSAAIKACILTALIGSLIYFHFINLSVLLKILVRPEVLVFGVSAIFLSYVAATLRWWLILRSQRFDITYLHALQLYLISVFSLVFIPGGTASSDAVRILMLMRVAPGRRGQAMLVVVGDRMIAVFVLSLIAAILTLLQWQVWSLVPNDPMFWMNISALLIPVAFMSISCSGWLISRTRKYRAQSFQQNWFVRSISAVLVFFELAFQTPLNIILAIGASAITTGLLLSAIVIVSTVAEVPNLSAWKIARAAALSLFANGVPISPGGIGVGEAAFNQICIWLVHGKQHYPYATIFLAYRIISICVACSGAITLMNLGRLTSPVTPQTYPISEPKSLDQQ